MIEINIKNICQELNLDHHILVTRQIGGQVYEHIIKQFQTEASNPQAVILIFPPDQLVDPSFADETILRLQREFIDAEGGSNTIIVQGLTNDSIHNLNAAIKYQNLKLPLLSLSSDRQWNVIGQLEQSLRETLDLVFKNSRLTAPELAKLLNLAINTASNRLKRLYDLRLVRRDYEITENGLQYIYHFWL